MSTPVNVVAVVFPDVTQLDMTGPLQVFASLPDVTITLAWHRIEPVMTDLGFAVVPTVSFDDAPQADVLLVPGGNGVDALVEDEVALEFVRQQALGARFVTSVCTGAFVLGAAGLLNGKRATTHWASHDLLDRVGAIPVRERVVRDGSLITGGGVTSGIDFALTVAAVLFDADTARRVQLQLEYDPQPPYDAGTPDRPEADSGEVRAARAEVRARREPILHRVAARLGLE